MRPAGFVLDANVAICWFFAEEEAARAYAAAVLSLIMESAPRVLVPAHFHVEVAQFLLRRRRTPAARFGNAKLAKALDALDVLGLETHVARITYREVIAAADEFHVQAKDAPYVMLAKSQDLPIATLDGGIRQACTAHRMQLLAFN